MKCPYCRNASLVIPSDLPWYFSLVRPVLQKAYCYSCSSSVAVRGALLFGWKLPIGASHVVAPEEIMNVAKQAPTTLPTSRPLAHTLRELRMVHSEQELEQLAYSLLEETKSPRHISDKKRRNKTPPSTDGSSAASSVTNSKYRRKSVSFSQGAEAEKALRSVNKRRRANGERRGNESG